MRYRKKPVVIEAALWGSESEPEWLSEAIRAGRAFRGELDGRKLCISTLEGVMVANLGDWIIKGVQGELYPCKPAIFAATYEPAEN